MADVLKPPYRELRFFQSAHKLGQFTHIYATDHLTYHYKPRMRTEMRPKAMCGRIIFHPRYSAAPLGRMCVRCEEIVADCKLPHYATEAI